MSDQLMVHRDLDDEERVFLREALHQVCGPASPTDALAQALGFSDRADMLRSARRLRDRVAGSRPLTRPEWRRVLAIAEFMFASDVFGAGVEWSTVTGLSDEESIATLRALQSKLI